MPTTDELLRTASALTDFEIKFYVGPKRALIDRENMLMGENFDPTVSTYLTASCTIDSTTITVANASRFTSGAFMIHPNGADEAYEFIRFGSRTQTTFGNLSRVMGDVDDSDFLWGKHSSGATVSEFFDITGLVESMKLDFTESDGVALWKVIIEGRGYDSFLLDNDNAVAAHIRQRPYNGDLNSWTPWTLWWLGYIKDADITDDGAGAKEWRAEVQGLSQYVAATETPPRHYGKNDLAEGKSVQVSSFLVDPYQEFGTGEYNGFPSLEGNQVNDGDLATLWISDGEPDPGAEEPVAAGMEINEVYLRPLEGYVTRDHQWIELFLKRGDSKPADNLKYFSLCGKDTTYKKVVYRTDENPDWEAWVPEMNWVNLPGGSLEAEEGSFVILTFNRAKFMEFYPQCDAAMIVDLRPYIIGTFELDVDGGFIILRQGHVNAASNVWWTASDNAAWQAIAPYITDGDDDLFWQGSMITVPPRAHSFRRDPCGNGPNLDIAKDNLSYWETDEVRPTPGYYFSGDPEWVDVDLGEMGILLEDELPASETGYMQLNKQPLGLRSAGYVRINAEIIAYTTRNDVDNKLEGLSRGQAGTSAALQPAESIVKAQDSLAGEADPTTNHLVSSVSWKRKPVQISGTGRFIVPEVFEIYVSEFAEPVLPDSDDWDEPVGQGGWQDYWERVQTVSGWSQTSWLSAFSPRRARHVLMIIRKMTDGGRVKLNTFSVWADTVDLIEVPPDADDETRDAIDGAYSGAIIYDLLTRDIGLDSALFTMEDDGRPYSDLRTTATTVMNLMRDICRRTGCSVVFELNEEVTHRFNPLYPLADLETVHTTWTRDNARKVSLSRPFRHNVRQVVVQGLESRDEESFKAVYPITPLDFGSTVKVEDWILEDPNDASLMAEYTFRQRNAPLSAVVVPVGPAEWVRPGQRHVINWDMDEDGQYLRNRNFVVTSVSFTLRFGGGEPGAKRFETSIQLKELIF